MSEDKVIGHIVGHVSNMCTFYAFQVRRTNHSEDMAVNRAFDHEKSLKKKRKKSSNRISSNQINLSARQGW